MPQMDLRQPAIVRRGLDGPTPVFRPFRRTPAPDTRGAGAMNSSASAMPGDSDVSGLFVDT